MQKPERRPGETAAVRDRGGAGGPARRLGWRPTGKMPIGGRRAKAENTSKSCDPGGVELPGVSKIALAVGLKQGLGLLWW